MANGVDPGAKYASIPSALILEKFQVGESPSNEGLVFLFVGALLARKGLPLLLQKDLGTVGAKQSQSCGSPDQERFQNR